MIRLYTNTFESHIEILGQVHFMGTRFPEGICRVELFGHAGRCPAVARMVKLTCHRAWYSVTEEEYDQTLQNIKTWDFTEEVFKYVGRPVFYRSDDTFNSVDERHGRTL